MCHVKAKYVYEFVSIHTCIHAYSRQTYRHADMHPGRQADRHTDTQTHMQTGIHTCMRAYKAHTARTHGTECSIPCTHTHLHVVMPARQLAHKGHTLYGAGALLA